MITAILISICGILNSIMDVLYFRFDQSVFSNIKNKNLIQFIDPEISWINKWKDGIKSKGERFFGSSTFLVWLTDLWHLTKTLMIGLICLSCILYTPIVNPLIDLAILYCSFTITFQLFFKYIWIKK